MVELAMNAKRSRLRAPKAAPSPSQNGKPVAVRGQEALRFDGSIWCNLDIGLRNLDQIYGKALSPLDLSPIEWYILQALHERDGQHPSALARTIGRAPTAFTPILDKLERKALVLRKPDSKDRRSIFVHLTPAGREAAEGGAKAVQQTEAEIRQALDSEALTSFENVLLALQRMQLK
jgi:DNA-binding MarR family transcriptional regulator